MSAKLTERKKDRTYFNINRPTTDCNFNYCPHNTNCLHILDRTCPYLTMIDKLAAYEDTDLTPEEIIAMKGGRR